MKKLLVLSVLLISAIMLNAQDAAQMITDANQALQDRDYATAFELYDAALQNLGDVEVDMSINFNVGYAAYQAQMFEQAIEYLNKAIEAEANVSTSYQYIANSYNKLGDFANALANFEKAIETADEVNSAMVYNAAIAAYKAEIFDKSADLFNQCIDADFQAESSYYYKAVVLNRLGQDDEYKQTLIEGAEKFPGDDKIGPTLANLYVLEGNELYKSGVEILNSANLQVNDGNMTTEDAAYTAEVDKAKSEFQSAAEILEKATLLDASNENAQILLDACKQNMNL